MSACLCLCVSVCVSVWCLSVCLCLCLRHVCAQPQRHTPHALPHNMKGRQRQIEREKEDREGVRDKRTQVEREEKTRRKRREEKTREILIWACIVCERSSISVAFGGDKIWRLSSKLLPAAGGSHKAAQSSPLFQTWFPFSSTNNLHNLSFSP